MRFIIWVAIAVVSISSVGASNDPTQQKSKFNPPFWKDLQAGPYATGFRVLYKHDQSRKWLKAAGATRDPGRPIRVSLWYPAVPSKSSRQMTYGDYFHHEGPSEFKQFNEQLDRMDIESWLSDLRDLKLPSESTFRKLIKVPTAAYLNAPFAHGTFPLVLYSGGKASRADDNLELAEYLASYGYVVATVPQLGPSDQELELGSSPKEISLHTDDFDVALTMLRKLPEIKLDQIATAGHSAGGEAAVELALRHPEVRVVIGLDASYGMKGGKRVFLQLPEYDPGRQMAASLLDLRRADGAQGVSLDLSAIDALRWTEVYRVTFDKAFHGDFTEWGMLAFVMKIPMPPMPYEHTRQIGYDVNRSAYHAVLDFLDAKLCGRQESLLHLTQAIGHQSGATLSHFSNGDK